MLTVEDRLRAAAAEVNAHVETLPVPAWEPETRPVATPPVRRGVAVLVAAVVIVLVAVGGMLLLLRLSTEEPPVVTTLPPTTTTIAPETTTTTTVPPEPTVGAWGRVGTEVMQPIVGIFDIAGGPSGLVVAAFDPGDNGRQDGVIFVSEDGRTWQRLGEGDPALTIGAVLMYGIAQSDTGIVGVGMGCENEEEPCAAYPTVWMSPDGTTWMRTGPDPEVFGEIGAMLDVVATDDGFVAVGSVLEFVTEEDFLQHPTIWFSPDGADWERVYTDPATGPAMQRAAVGPEGRVIVVGQVEEEGADDAGHAAIWISPDGQSWERVQGDAAIFGPADGANQVSLHAAAVGPQGFLAVGTQDGFSAVILRSRDGTNWERVESVTMPSVGSLSAVAAIEGGWVAAGPHGFANAREDVPAVWASPDGVEWYRAVNLGAGYVMGMVATDTYLAAAGAISGFDNFHAGVWIGPIPDPADFDAAVDEPAVDRVETLVEAVGNDASCADVAAAGFDYLETVAYWEVRERDADMDPDDNGIPCEVAYSAREIEVLLGPAGALDVFIEETAEDTFFASGPAVDAGLICPDGTWEWLGEMDAQHEREEWRWQARHTCDDGSGEFLIDASFMAHSQQALAEYGYARLGSGTGNHADLQGGGGIVTSWETGANQIRGRVWIGEPPRPEPLSSIADVAADTSCGDLYAKGYDLVEVVAYGERYDRPESLDPDGNGIPCEDEYSAAEIEDLFGPADAVAVTLLSDISTMTFTAEGPAVDAGQMCPSGTIEFTGDLPPHRRAEWRWRDRYTCDDGSGSIIVDVEVFATSGPDMWQSGRLVEGTGELAGLAGGGGVRSVFDGYDRFTGRMWATGG